MEIYVFQKHAFSTYTQKKLGEITCFDSIFEMFWKYVHSTMLYRFSKIQIKHKPHRKTHRVFSQWHRKNWHQKSKTSLIDAKKKFLFTFLTNFVKSKGRRDTVRLLTFLYFRTSFYLLICLSEEHQTCILRFIFKSCSVLGVEP